MKDVVPLGERLAPDTIAKLERAAQHRFATAEILRTQKRRLAALYLYGYSAEICLSAAYYRSSGLAPNTPIDRAPGNGGWPRRGSCAPQPGSR